MSPSSRRVAVVQMTSGDDRDRNLETAERWVRRAAADGADLVVLPEKWNLIDVGMRQAERAEERDGPSLSAAASWARECAVVLVAGSISERIAGDVRAFNTCVVFGTDGAALATYRKIHLFDVEVGGHVYRESDATRGGDEVVCVDIGGQRLGLSICYDLRFPELYRALASDGADMISVPAAFTDVTGAAHWEVLLRARAIENQAAVLAAGQVGMHATGTASYGHSMIVDAWGTVLARVQEGEGIAVADVDLAAQRDIRHRLPVASHRRIGLVDRPSREILVSDTRISPPDIGE